MPVVALQGPVQHHGAAGQAAVAEGASDTEGIAGATEGRGKNGFRFARRSGGPCPGRRCRWSGQLAHHHPGGGLHRLGNEEGIIQIRGGRGAGLPPELPGFPAEPEGGCRQGKEVAPIATVDHQFRGDLDELLRGAGGSSRAQHGHLADPGTPALDLQHPTARPPGEPGFGGDPTPQDPLRRGGSVAEAAHPVVIQPIRLLGGQTAQQGPPQTGLPGREFIAIRATHPCGAHHAPQPGSRGEQQGASSRTGCLQGCRDATAAATPNQDGRGLDGGDDHRKCASNQHHGSPWAPLPPTAKGPREASATPQ